MTYDQLDQLSCESSPIGNMLREMISFAFRSHRSELGLEGIYLHDAVALVAALHPELFHMEEMAGDVETAGNLTTGQTVFDRRVAARWRPNMEVAVEIDVPAVMDCILRGLDAVASG